MNFLRNAATRYVTQYKQAYLETGRFRPVVHVMWVIGISGFVYEGYHHHHLEKLHTQAAEHKKIELKQAHSDAVKALEAHEGEILTAQKFIDVSKASIEGAKHHIAELRDKQKLLKKAVEDSKTAYETYKPPEFGH